MKDRIDEAIDMFFTITVICATIGIGMEKSQKIIKAYALQGMTNSLALFKFMEMDPIPFYEANKERIRALAPIAINFITPHLNSDDIVQMMKHMEEDIKKMKEEEAGEDGDAIIKKANEILGNNL